MTQLSQMMRTPATVGMDFEGIGRRCLTAEWKCDTERGGTPFSSPTPLSTRRQTGVDFGGEPAPQFLFAASFWQPYSTLECADALSSAP